MLNESADIDFANPFSASRVISPVSMVKELLANSCRKSRALGRIDFMSCSSFALIEHSKEAERIERLPKYYPDTSGFKPDRAPCSATSKLYILLLLLCGPLSPSLLPLLLLNFFRKSLERKPHGHGNQFRHQRRYCNLDGQQKEQMKEAGIGLLHTLRILLSTLPDQKDGWVFNPPVSLALFQLAIPVLDASDPSLPLLGN